MGKDLNGKELGKGFSQRKDGRYEARTRIGGVQIDIYDRSLAQLKKKFEMEKAKVLRNERTDRTNLTLLDWFDEWFETCKAPQLKSDLSRAPYRRKIRNTYCKVLGDKKVCEITQLNIQNATNEFIEVQRLSIRTVREALGVLRECLDVAVLNNILKINPCTHINIKNENEAVKERRVLALWEQEMFLQEASSRYFNEAYHLLLLTGMRIGEFSGLQWQDVDFDNKTIHIRRSLSTGYFKGRKVEELTSPKTQNSYREIPFFNETERLFRAWKSKQEKCKYELGERWRAKPELGDLVFTNTMGGPASRYVMAHDINRIETNMRLKEETLAGQEGRIPRNIEHIHPHAFRHTFATRCFEKGMDPVVIQSIMGHADYATTLSYTHVLSQKRQEEAAKMGDFLSA